MTQSNAADPHKPLPQPEHYARADWWLDLEIPEKREELAVRIGDSWMSVDPEWGLAWMASKLPRPQMLKFLTQKLDSDSRMVANYPTESDQSSFTYIYRHNCSALVKKLRTDFPDQAATLIETHETTA